MVSMILRLQLNVCMVETGENSRKGKPLLKIKINERLLIPGNTVANSDLGNCKVCLLVSMILRLTLNVGMITGVATTEGKPRPVRHEPFTDTIGYLSANKPVWCKVVDGIDIECWYNYRGATETTEGKLCPVRA